jgi:hypothetical protein
MRRWRRERRPATARTLRGTPGVGSPQLSTNVQAHRRAPRMTVPALQGQVARHCRIQNRRIQNRRIQNRRIQNRRIHTAVNWR